MAALILGCIGLGAQKISQRRNAKKELKREYAENFEQLKAENAARHSMIEQRHNSSAGNAFPTSGRLPSYDDAVHHGGRSIDKARGSTQPMVESRDMSMR